MRLVSNLNYAQFLLKKVSSAFLTAVLQFLSLVLFVIFVSFEVKAENATEVAKAAQRGEKVLTQKDFPILNNTLIEVFNNLTAAQAELFPEGYKEVNEVTIIESGELNAWVTIKKDPGMKIVRNSAVITTALIDFLMRTEDGLFSGSTKDINDGVARIAGVWAHELAHPIDNFDQEGIKSKNGATAGAQARELRADADGTEIARRSGYPPDGLYNALARLAKHYENWVGEKTQTLVGVSLKSHPPDDLRLSTLKFLLTGKRYISGFFRPSVQPKYRPALVRELQIQKNREHTYWSYQAPKTRLETLTRMMAILEKYEYGRIGQQLLEYNRLQLSLDQMLKDLGTADFPEEKLYFEVKAKELENKNLKIHSKNNWEQEFRAVPQAFRTPPQQDHFDLAGLVPFYSSEKSIDFLKGIDFMGATEKQGAYTNKKYSIWSVARVLSPQKAFEIFQTEIIERILQDKPFDQTLDGEGLSRAMKKNPEIPPPFQLEMMDLYHSEIFERLLPWNRLIVATENELTPTIQNKAMASFLEEQVRTSQGPRIRSIFQKIWQNRGFFGATDFFKTSQEGRIHWSLIFSALGIEPTKGYEELSQSVKLFMKSKGYIEMLDVIPRKNGGYTVSFLDTKIFGADPIAWADADFFGLVLGQKNPHFKESVLRFAVFVPGRILSVSNGNGLKDAIAKAVAEELKKRNTYTKEALEKKYKEIAPLFGISEEEIGPSEPIFHRVIQLLPLTVEQRNQIYKDVFANRLDYKMPDYESDPSKVPTGYEWIEIRQDEFNKNVLKEMIEQQHFQDFLEVILYWANSIQPAPRKPKEAFKYFSQNNHGKGLTETSYRFFIVISDFAPEIIHDLNARVAAAKSPAAKKKIILEVIYRLVDPGKGKYSDIDVTQSQGFRSIKDALFKTIETLPFTLEEKRYLFERLTGTGPTESSDHFAVKNFPELQGLDGKTRDSRKWILRMTEQGRFFDLGLQARLVLQLIQPEIQIMKATMEYSVNELDRLIQQIVKYMPNGSRQRDELLEKVAWELKDLTGTDLSAFIEDYKSLNWRRPSPLLVNLGSAVTEKIRQFNPAIRREFIDYLIHKNTKKMPESVWQELKQQSKAEAQKMLNDFGFLKKIANKSTSQDHLDRLAEMLADQLRMQIERHVAEATPLELTPFFELIINAGPQSLVKAPGYPKNLLREFLKFKPDSIEEKMTLAYLDVIDSHERTVSLAYLLSHSGPNKNSSKALFEVFQTAGIKFGQMAFIWKFLGPEIAKAAAELKDNATPMSKSDIEKVLKQRLGNSSIKLLRILGSASIKTVVEIEYIKDGKTKIAVVAVQRPDALGQVTSNLDIGRRFLKRLAERGVAIPSHIASIYIDNLEEQIKEELKMTLEAAKIPELQRAVTQTSAFLKLNHAGYSVYVPGLITDFPVRDDLLFMDKAEGFPLRFFQPGAAAGTSEDAIRIRQTLTRYFAREISGGQKLDKLMERVWQETAPVAAELSLRMGFRTGWFESDRHSGNFLIDPRSKSMAFIDVAQAQHWNSKSIFKADEMYHLVRFLKGLSDGNAHDVMQAAMRMTNANLSETHQAQLEEKLKRLAGLERSEYAIQVVNTLLENGLKLPRKLTFGPLRMLLIVQGENYLSPEQFELILREEVTRIFKAKFPTMANDYIGQLFDRAKSNLRSRFSMEVGLCKELFAR